MYGYRWRMINNATGDLVVDEIDAGPLTSGLASVQLDHAEVYCIQTQANNVGGTWSDWSSRCFKADQTPPIFNALGAVTSDPYQPYDGWLMRIATSIAPEVIRRAQSTNPFERLSSELVNVTEWNRTERTASNLTVPYIRRDFRPEYLWDPDAVDSLPLLNISHVDLSYVNGQPGVFQTMRVRWGMGDPESYIWAATPCTLSLGIFKGDNSILDRIPLSNASHVYDITDLTYSNSLAWNATSAGLFDVRTAWGYYEALVHYPAAGLSGFTLYPTIRCTNGALDEGRANAVYGVLIDQSGPLVYEPRLKAGLKQWDLIDYAFQNNSAQFNVSWYNAWVEPESDISYVSVWLGTSPNASDIMKPTRVAGLNPSWAYWGNLNLTHKTLVHATVQAANIARPAALSPPAKLEPVLIDLTPATFAAVGDGNELMPAAAWKYSKVVNASVPEVRDIQFVDYAYSFFASWKAEDPESGISAYQIAVVDNATGAIVSDGWREVVSSATYLNLNPIMVHNRSYNMLLRVRNRAGSISPVYRSSGLIYDATRPYFRKDPVVYGNVTILQYNETSRFSGRQIFNGSAVAVISSVDPFFRFKWDAFDPESGIAEAYVQVGTFPGGDDIYPLTSVSANGNFSLDAVAYGLLSGGAYYATVQSWNFAGGWNWGFGLPVTVDLLGPAIGPILDTASIAEPVDIRYSGNNRSASAAWPLADDQHTRIVSCWAALGNGTSREADQTRFLNWTLAPDVRSIQANFTTPLPSNTLLTWSVRCVDSVGNNATASSNGFAIDLTPPVANVTAGQLAVLDGSYAAFTAAGEIDLTSPDVSWWTAANEFFCRFPSIVDPESGVPDLQAFVSTGSDITTAVPLVAPIRTRGLPYAYFQGLNLTSGSTVYCHVTAFNGVGFSANFSSNGAKVDFSPPVCEFKLVLPSIVRMDGTSVTNWTAALELTAVSRASDGLAALIRCNDSISGVSSIEVALGYYPGETQLLPFTPLPSTGLRLPIDGSGIPVDNLSLSRSDLARYTPFDNGRALYFAVRSRNGANLTSVTFSRSAVLDETPPVPLPLTWPFTEGIVFGPSRFNVPITSTANGTHVNVTSYFIDAESNVTLVSVGLITYAGSVFTTTLPLSANGSALSSLSPDGGAFTNVSTTQGLVTAVLPLPAAVATALAAGNSYSVIAIARVLNSLGLESRYRSGLMVIDSAPPQCSPPSASQPSALVLNGLSGADLSLQNYAGTISARWKCVDAGSGIQRVELGVEKQDATSLVWSALADCTPVNVGNASSGALSCGQIIHAGKYRAVVTAYDKVGLVTVIRSSGLTVDVTPPELTVTLGMPLIAGVHRASSWVALNVSRLIDAESGVALVTYTIGSSGDGSAKATTDVTSTILGASASTSLFTNRIVNVTGLSLVLGKRYSVTVTATNLLSGVTTASTIPFLVDTTFPDKGTSAVRALVLPPAFDSQPFFPAVINNTNVTVGFTGWRDLESGLDSMTAALYVVPSLDSVAPLPAASASLPSSAVSDPDALDDACYALTPTMVAKLGPFDPTGLYSLTFTGVPVCNKSYLVPIITAKNAIGQEVGGTGTPYRVAVSRLVPGRVRDGFVQGVDVNGLPVNNGLWANWVGFYDTLGYPLSYEVGWSTTPGNADFPGAGGWGKVKGANPNNASVVDSVKVPDGTTIYASVRVTSVYGAQAVVSSDGVLHDGSPPVLTHVGIADVIGAHSPSIVPGTNLTVNWNCSDPHSNVTSVDISIGTSVTNATNLMPPRRFTGLAAGTGVLVTPLVPSYGSILIASLTCSNGAGLQSTRLSSYSYVDNTPPLPRSLGADGAALAVGSSWPLRLGSTLVNGSQFLTGDGGSLRAFYAAWDIIDEQSGVSNNRVCIGTGPDVNVTALGPCVDIGPNATIAVALNGTTCDQIMPPGQLIRAVTCLNFTTARGLAHASEVYVSVTATNFGRQNTSVVARALVDLIPPAAASGAAYIVYAQRSPVNNSIVSIAADSTAPFAPRRLALELLLYPQRWTSLSPVVAFFVSVAYAQNGTDVIAPTRVLTSQLEASDSYGLPGGCIASLAPLPGAFFVPGVNYSVTIVGQSQIGYRSAAVTLSFQPDDKPPAIAFVAIGDAAANATALAATGWRSLSNVTFSFSASDDIGLSALEARVCNGDDLTIGCSMMPWVRLSGTGFTSGTANVTASYTLRNLQLDPGKRYYAQLRATDFVGQAAVYSSPAVICDDRRPVPGAFIGPRGYVPHPADVRASFTPFVSSSVPITSHELAVLRSSDKLTMTSPLLNWTAVPTIVLEGGYGSFNGARVSTLSFSLAAAVANGSASISFASLASSMVTAGNITLAIRGTNAAGVSAVIYSEILLLDLAAPTLDAAFVANPALYAQRRASITGTNVTVQAGGLSFYRRVLVDAGNSTNATSTLGREMRVATTGINVATGVGVAWSGIVDPQSGVSDSAFLSLTSCVPASNNTSTASSSCATIVKEQPVSFSAGYFLLQGFPIVPNATFNASLRVTNGAAASATFTTKTPLLIDLDAPVVLAVADGFPLSQPLPLGWPARPASVQSDDSDYWLASDFVAGSWAASDSSGIAEYRWAVCKAHITEVLSGPSADCPLPWTSAGAATSGKIALSAGYPLVSGGAYRTWVMAIDGAGNSAIDFSDGYSVDTSAPNVTAYRLFAPSFASNWRDLRISLDGLRDDESAIYEVQVCLSTVSATNASRPLTVTPCVPIDISASVIPRFESYVSASGAKAADALIASEASARLLAANRSSTRAALIALSIDVVVFNRAGLSVRFTAGSVTLDPTPPAASWLLPVDGNDWASLQFNGSFAPSYASLVGSANALSLTRSVTNCVFFSSGAPNCTASDVSSGTSARFATRNITSLGFAWSLVAPKSGISALSYSLGTSCGASDVIGSTALPSFASSVALATLNLRHGNTYVFSLNVTSGAGIVAQFCSDAVLADTVPPSEGIVVDGHDPITTATFTDRRPAFCSDGSVRFQLLGFNDNEGPLDHYEARVCEADGSTCINEWTNIGLRENVTIVHQPMVPGKTYRVNVRAYDIAGNFAQVQSSGQIYDLTVPTPPRRLTLDQYVIPSWDKLAVDFEDFIDGESGIRAYAMQVAVSLSTTSYDLVLPLTEFGPSTYIKPTGDALALMKARWDGGLSSRAPRPLSFLVTVTAFNNVGLNSSRQVLGKMDDSAPTGGEVAFLSVDAVPSRSYVITNVSSAINATGRVEALIAQVDLSQPPTFQRSRSSLTFAFRGFDDPQLHLLFGQETLFYVYGVGSTAGADDVVSFTRFYLPDFISLNGSILQYGSLPGSDPATVHLVQLTGLDLAHGSQVFVTGA